MVKNIIVFLALFGFMANGFARDLPFLKQRQIEGHGAYDEIDEVRNRKEKMPRFHHKKIRKNIKSKIDQLPESVKEKALAEIKRHRKKMREILGDKAKQFRDKDFISKK